MTKWTKSRITRYTNYKKTWETVTLTTDDGEEWTLQKLFQTFPVYKFVNTNNRMFKLMINYTDSTFEKKITTVTKASWRMLKPIIKWGLKYEKRQEKARERLHK